MPGLHVEAEKKLQEGDPIISDDEDSSDEDSSEESDDDELVYVRREANTKERLANIEKKLDEMMADWKMRSDNIMMVCQQILQLVEASAKDKGTGITASQPGSNSAAATTPELAAVYPAPATLAPAITTTAAATTPEPAAVYPAPATLAPAITTIAAAIAALEIPPIEAGDTPMQDAAA